MRAELEQVLKILRREKDTRDFKKMNQALAQALQEIRRALESNPELVPTGQALRRRKSQGLNLQGINVKDKSQPESNQSADAAGASNNDKSKSAKAEKEPPKINIEKTLSKRIRLKNFGVSCAFAHLGEEGPEALSEGNLIYINQDHPLYLKYFKNKNENQIHLLRLITQEISMMKRLRLPAREAFELQSKLLKDAVISK